MLIIYFRTLGDALKVNKDFYLNLYQYYQEQALNIKNEVLDPSKKFLDDQNNQGKKLQNDMKKIEKEFKDAVLNLEKAKIKFHTSAKAAEIGKLDSELAKVTYIPQQDKDKFHLKSTNLLKEAKDAERQYIAILNNTNAIRASYIEIAKNILMTYQVLEEEFIEFTQNILRKQIIYTNVTFKNSIYDIEKVNNVFSYYLFLLES